MMSETATMICVGCSAPRWGGTGECQRCFDLARLKPDHITQPERMEALEERVEALEKRLSLLDWKA